MQNSVKVVIVIKGALEELQRVKHTGGEVPRDRKITRCTTLNGHAIKLNCDASSCSQTRRRGKGVVARNESGQVMGGVNWRTYRDNVEGLEANAILEGIKLAIKKGWQNIEVESDSQVEIEPNPRENEIWKTRSGMRQNQHSCMADQQGQVENNLAFN